MSSFASCSCDVDTDEEARACFVTQSRLRQANCQTKSGSYDNHLSSCHWLARLRFRSKYSATNLDFADSGVSLVRTGSVLQHIEVDFVYQVPNVISSPTACIYTSDDLL